MKRKLLEKKKVWKIVSCNETISKEKVVLEK